MNYHEIAIELLKLVRDEPKDKRDEILDLYAEIYKKVIKVHKNDSPTGK